jgi:hypothetical protein
VNILATEYGCVVIIDPATHTINIDGEPERAMDFAEILEALFKQYVC